MDNKRTIIFMIVTILWVICLGNLMEIGENMRFRWLVDVFVFTLVLIIIQKLIIKMKKLVKGEIK